MKANSINEVPLWTETSLVLEELTERLTANKPLSVLTGAGVSIESGIPSAQGVVSLLAERGRVGRDNITYQQAMVEAFSTDGERSSFLRQMCHRRSAGVANQTLAILARDFNVAPLLTTNFDHLLEQACVAHNDRPVVVKVLGAPNNATNSTRGVQIVKLHGDIHFDITAHSDDEMASHHQWMREWAQLSFDADSVLLVLGHSGLDGPIRTLIHDLLNTAEVDVVLWGVYEHESVSNLAVIASLQDLCGHDRLHVFKHPGADQFLSGIYSAASGDSPPIKSCLLPGFQTVTGLMPGSAEVDALGLAESSTPADTQAFNRYLRRGTSRLVQIEATRGRAEIGFRAAASVAIAHASHVAAFALDEADTSPNHESLLRAIVGWVARTTGFVAEPSRAHEAITALAGLNAAVVINLAQAFQTHLAVAAIQQLAQYAPNDLRIWVVTDEGEDIEGFRHVRHNSPGALLPSATIGILAHVRRTLDETAVRKLLEAEGNSRSIDALVKSGVIFRRGKKIVVDRARWAESEYIDRRTLEQAITTIQSLAGHANALEASNWAADLEALCFTAATEFPLRRMQFARQAIHWLMRSSLQWQSRIGTAYFVKTLTEVMDIASAEVLSELDTSDIGEIYRTLAHWSTAPMEWLGNTSHFAPLADAQRRLKFRLRRTLLGYPELGPEHSDEALTKRMTNLEAAHPGIAYLFAGWLVRHPTEARDPSVRTRLLNLAESCSSGSAEASALAWDDVALTMYASGDVKGAIEVWEKITDRIVGMGGRHAVIHLSNFGIASLDQGDMAAASNMLFESVLIAGRNGDEARAWRAAAFLTFASEEADVPASFRESRAPIDAWIDSWLAQVERSDNGGSRRDLFVALLRRRGLELVGV